MKKAIPVMLAALLLLSVFACKKNTPGYTVEGTVTASDSTWIMLKKRDEGKVVTVDSVQPKDGKFEFKGKVDMPEMYFLTMKGKQGGFPFFIENSPLSLTVYADSLDKSVVKGSASHDQYLSYQKEESVFTGKMDAMYEQYMQANAAKDTVITKRLDRQFDSLQQLMTNFTKNYILKNGKSVVAAYLAISNAYAYSLDELKAINKAMDPSIAQSVYVKKLAEREGILQKVQPGQPAPIFSMADSTGKAVNLSDFKGKVVLVDFWASWCSPCRRENPNVVAAFNKFGPAGFTVLGVSLDESREKWIAAIAKDGLTWTHVSDLSGWNNAAAKLYGVMAIPSNFLIDKDGMIVATNLQGEALTLKLSEVLAIK